MAWSATAYATVQWISNRGFGKKEKNCPWKYSESTPYRCCLVCSKIWDFPRESPQTITGFDEARRFEKSLQLFNTNVLVDEYNFGRLRDLQKPVINIKAKHTGREARNASYEEADNLHESLLICIGARIRLSQNIWVDQGLVNGSMGTVHDIIWPVGADIYNDLPLALLVKFDDRLFLQMKMTMLLWYPFYRFDENLSITMFNAHGSSFQYLLHMRSRFIRVKVWRWIRLFSISVIKNLHLARRT